MSRTQLQNGSQGSYVKELQKILNQNGYKLTEDGIFGSKTEAAVRDYQQKNNLTVDGVVGPNTWSSLDKVSSGSGASNTSKFEYDDFSYAEYEESDTVKQAENALNAQISQKPGAYQSQWQGQLDDTMKKILNREDFSYDLNGDALYQQYRDQYIQQGKLAMQDTMGQAAAMTGGYGSSYAQSVGQQAYNAQLDKLNDIVPELYQMALDKYNREGQDLYNQYGMLSDRESLDYDRYRDVMSDWYTERDYLAGRYDSERDYDYGKYDSERKFAYGQYSDDRALSYDEYRDAIADQQWEKDYDLSNRQLQMQEEAWAMEKAEKQKTVDSTTYSGSGTTETGSSYNNGNYSDAQVKAAQKLVGANPDGKWGPNSTAAAKKAGYGSLAEVVAALGGGGSEPTKDDYADWGYGEWESYFAQIRQSEGQSAAEEELNYFTSKGFIPQKYVAAGASGARGGKLGH